MGVEAGHPSGLVVGTDLPPDVVTTLALSECAGAGWRVALAGGAVAWTPGMAALLGLRDADEKTITRALRAVLKPLINDARANPQQTVFEHTRRFDTATGPSRWTHFRAQRFEEGGTQSLIGVAADATDKEAAQRSLADLTDRYRLLIELSPDAIVVHQQGKVVYVNSATLRFLGVASSAEIIGRPITDFVHPESRAAMRDRLLHLTSPGDHSEPARAVLLKPDGDTLTVESVSVHTTWEGRTAYQVILRDITAQLAAEAALRYQAALVTHVSDAIIATDADWAVTSINPAAETIFGVSPDQAMGLPLEHLLGRPVPAESVTGADGALLTTRRRGDGEPQHLRVSGARMTGGYVFVCADETARRRAEQFFATVVASLEEGVIVLNRDGRIESANPAAGRIFGLPVDGMTSRGLAGSAVYDENGRRFTPESLPSTVTRLTGQPQNSRTVRLKRHGRDELWLSLSCRPLQTETGPPYTVVASFSDNTERRQIGDRLRYEATHDSLTDLANRSLVVSRLSEALDAKGRRHEFAVLFVDLDKFKVINDSLGHSVGDEVLRIVAKRLRNSVRSEDLVGRLGGDEFAVVDFDVRRPEEVAALAKHIRERLVDPIVVFGRDLHVDASIGIVLAGPADSRTAEDIIRDADVAMYQAKTTGRGRFEFFDVALRERLQRRLRLEQDLRKALDTDELWMAYQPVVDLPTGRTIGVEALLRWHHPVLGVISPVEFIPLAEESDLINKIGFQTMRQTTHDMARRRREDGLDLHVAVNLSARQLDDPDLLGTVRRALNAAGMPPSALCLEITESTLMRDPDGAASRLAALRRLGVTLAIDDFGTGYASLAQLLRLPLDLLKIDRSFVSDLGESSDAAGIVGGIVAMAHAVGLVVIAEGVETIRQAEILRRLGCDQAQGYYFGRPEPTSVWRLAETS